MTTDQRASRKSAILALVLAGGTAWTMVSRSPSAAKQAQPSILLITLDTVRADHLGCYGYSHIQTPNIDRLAAESIRFANAYTQVPITLPAHVALLTGTYPMFNGVRDFTSSGLSRTVPTLAEILARNGYRTAAFVSSFVLNSMWGLNRGFTVYDDRLDLQAGRARDLFLVMRPGDQTVDRFLAWLQDNGNRPFFAWLHLYDAHSPYKSPEAYRSRYPGRPYDAAIAFDDAQVGRVFERLGALGLYENTLIVLASDHGESLGEHGESEHGFFVYNSTIHIPLIVKLPGTHSAAAVVSAVVGAVDVAPAITTMLKIPSSETRSFQGRSLLRFVGQSQGGTSEPVYAESYYPRNSFGWHELRALVTRDFEYIAAPRPELYDLDHDPGEGSNLVAKNSAMASALRERLSDLEERFSTREIVAAGPPPDPETLEKLKSLGYVGYKAPSAGDNKGTGEADPKDKIAAFNRILRAGDLKRAGQHADAAELLAQLDKQEPDLYVIPFEQGENLLAWGKPQAAIEAFNRALARNPAFDQAALGLGRAYFDLHQNEKAVTALEVALSINPSNFFARLALAKVYWQQNRLDKVRQELEQVVRSSPDLAEARADYGIVLAQLRDYPKALPEIERGIALGYSEAVAYNYLGVTYAQLGRTTKAMQAYEKAVEIDPRYAPANLNLALQYQQQGQPAKAKDYYARVCRISNELCRQYAPQFSSVDQ